MDLIKCPVCGELYSPSYRRCPVCEELKYGRNRRGGRHVSDKKRSYSARGPLIVILLLVLALLSWYLFGGKIMELLPREEEIPAVEDPVVELPSNDDLFFDPTVGDEPSVGGEETPSTGDAPVVVEPSVDPAPADTPSVDLSSVELSSTDFTARVGENVKLTLTPEVEDVVWSVKDGSVASVSEDGVVRALTTGQTTVYAKVGDKTLECIVRVRSANAASDADVSNAALSKSDFTLKVGERYPVKVTGTTATPKWSIDDSSIASISSDGTVKALKKGHTNFYAKVGDKTLKGIVFVK